MWFKLIMQCGDRRAYTKRTGRRELNAHMRVKWNNDVNILLTNCHINISSARTYVIGVIILFQWLTLTQREYMRCVNVKLHNDFRFHVKYDDGRLERTRTHVQIVDICWPNIWVNTFSSSSTKFLFNYLEDNLQATVNTSLQLEQTEVIRGKN